MQTRLRIGPFIDPAGGCAGDGDLRPVGPRRSARHVAHPPDGRLAAHDRPEVLAVVARFERLARPPAPGVEAKHDVVVVPEHVFGAVDDRHSVGDLDGEVEPLVVPAAKKSPAEFLRIPRPAVPLLERNRHEFVELPVGEAAIDHDRRLRLHAGLKADVAVACHGNAARVGHRCPHLIARGEIGLVTRHRKLHDGRAARRD